MTYHIKALGFAGAAALSVFAAGASASSIQLTYTGPSADNPKEVTIEDTPTGVTPVFNNPGAYGFKMDAGADPLGEFLAWCLDITSELGQDSAFGYKITNTPFDNSFGLNSVEKGRVQAVFDANYGTLDASDGLEAAGFQVALWNALYDDDEDAGDGSFSISSANQNGSDIIAKANEYLGLADGYDDGRQFKLTFLESVGDPEKQNLVAASPVPLPASALLLLGGLGGLGGLSALRRRKRTA